MNDFKRKLSIYSSKISNNKYLMLIRDSFAMLLPVICVGSLLGVLSWVILDPQGLIFGNDGLNIGYHITGLSGKAYINSNFVSILSHITYMCDVAIRGSFRIFGLLLVISLSYNLGKMKNTDGLSCAIVGVSSLLILLPQTFKDSKTGMLVKNVYSIDSLGSNSIIACILISLCFTSLFIKLRKNERLIIKMPSSVPPAVGESFSSLVPIGIVMCIAGFIAGLLNWLGLPTIAELIYSLLQKPLVGFSQAPIFSFIYVFIQQVLWWFGINGGSVTSPVANAVYLPAQLSNFEGATQHIFTDSFFNALGCHNWGLLIAIFIFSKNETWKKVGKIAFIPQLFNIGEPIMFGLPIMLNPILLIPSVLAPLAEVLVGYILMKMKLIAVFHFAVPWTVPAVLMGFLGVGGIGGAVLQIIYIAVSLAIYAPFVILNNSIKNNDTNI